MTYKELKFQLDLLCEQQLEQTAMVAFDEMEVCLDIKSVTKVNQDHYLDRQVDNGHVILTVSY